MLTDDLRFKALKHVQDNPQLTQRELAGLLGVSLGRTNYCLQALIEKGLLKAANFRNSKNKRAYMYKLTPSGLREKTALAVRFIKRKELERQALLGEIAELQRELEQQPAEEKA
ncbi:MarR family EPS-associated transcriptional regulator [Methylonatrum kenyense]|uniref:MarR family EPS-associated transcriptional regulator n=1 Tax=Methylonatrum kenyense TaxID=455253 RepID=UPI0020C0F178|nr:MarR family EPS-associated transcriptional regulator [Methylonatrum kenyense]MCK8516957.1 MarR family EPS-associated transcriptional regulator [Methylonatrum kenyense]